MTDLAGLVRSFAALFKPDPANQAKLRAWAQTARACDLPNVHAFIRDLELDPQAVIAALTLTFHNGRAEGVNTKTKVIKRQCTATPDSASSVTPHTAQHAPSPPKVTEPLS